jgi:hypothetical protein
MPQSCSGLRSQSRDDSRSCLLAKFKTSAITDSLSAQAEQVSGVIIAETMLVVWMNDELGFASTEVMRKGGSLQSKSKVSR